MNDAAMKKNASIWESIYRRGGAGSRLEFPCEDLVVSASRNLPGSGCEAMKLLDIGCGSGNNLVFFCAKGFDCCGVDVSGSALRLAGIRLRDAGLKAALRKIKNNDYPFKDAVFDVIIAWHVLSYNDSPGRGKVISEIRRILKPGGILLATYPTFKDFRAAYGRKIGAGAFEFVYPGSNQNGVIFNAAKTKKEAAGIFRGFDNLEIGYSEITVKNITNSHWLVSARK